MTIHSLDVLFFPSGTNDRLIFISFQGKPFNITVIQVYAPTSSTEEVEVERFYEDLQDLLELIPPKIFNNIVSIIKDNDIYMSQTVWNWSPSGYQ